MLRDRIPRILKWQAEGRQVVLATLVKVYGSAPQPLGAVMAVNDLMDFDGSVSGGCVEGDVVRRSLQAIKTGQAERVEYGISDEIAWNAGLACGGTIEVFIEPLHSGHMRIMELLQEKRFFAAVTLLKSGVPGLLWIIHPSGDIETTLGSQALDNAVLTTAIQALQARRSERVSLQAGSEAVEAFCAVHSPPARLIVIGAVHIASPLVRMANELGFETIVLDARSAFATRERFPHAGQLIIDWPAHALEHLGIDENTFLAFLSHDEKMDNPALMKAMVSKARYIGALGSRKTHAGRVKALVEMGATEAMLARIHAPIGLDIGAAGADQIALAILAEMVAVANGKAV